VGALPKSFGELLSETYPGEIDVKSIIIEVPGLRRKTQR
jgi:hypothetical protein